MQKNLDKRLPTPNYVLKHKKNIKKKKGFYL